ncbi:hypothetical protein [Brachybacterium sp. YJGR34]|uniref:hypothetical protein n=1 Tax=Brachybacterium sp. YJGR34 TaxID=2059911 RepID=UPI000E0BB6FA|nr:hypothetical protein [Brachybacterium sp. YJGR34]
MGSSRSITSRAADIFGVMSTTAGGIGIALMLWGQLVVAERHALRVRNGHPVMFDGIALLAPAPGLICALLALGLGTIGLLTRQTRRVWAVAGVITGAIAVACTVSGLPISLVPDPSTPQNL